MELNMKKKLLCCALLAGVGMANTAAAQSYDDRWYVGAGVGVGFFDQDRDVQDDIYGVIALGKMITPNISIDAELWHSNPDLTQSGVTRGFEGLGDFGDGLDVTERNWELMSLSIVGRYHFIQEGRQWQPYVALGIGAQEHHDGSGMTSMGFNQSRTGTDVLFLGGVGATWDLGYPYLRAEAGVRVDTDDGHDNTNNYVDGYLGFEFIFPIGPEAAPVAPPEPPPPAKTCADLDDDGDGVNNCDDKCPGSAAGAALGPDGCPVPPPEPAPEPKPYRG
jgi:OOP family OmpA-OmpF porin